jgi:hypothetical protein
MTPLFFSTFMYAPCKVVGAEAWPELLKFWLESEHLDDAPWHALRTLGQARRVAECAVHVDAGTYIDRCRCVAAGNFLYEAGRACDVWLTCDDDVYADETVIRQLVDVARETKGLCALPYLNRDGKSMTFRRVWGPTQRIAGAPVRCVDRVGMGLVAMHRDFVTTLADRSASFVDGDSVYPHIFRNGVEGRTFIGEDFWLCMLAERDDLPMHVLLEAPGLHMNLEAKLDLEGRICVKDPSVHEQLELLGRAPPPDSTLMPPPLESPFPSGD